MEKAVISFLIICLGIDTGVCENKLSIPNRPSELNRACTLIGCSSGARLTLLIGNTLPSGTYNIVTTVDGYKRSCELNYETVRHEVYCKVDDYSQEGPVVIYLFSGLGEIKISAKNPNPKSIEISFQYNNKSVYKGVFKPKYQSWHPNGPGCDLEPCLIWSEEITINLN